MRLLLFQALVIVLVFMGEALSIYAELLGAQHYTIAGKGLLGVFLRMFGVITIAGGFLIAGYILGYLSFKNIWIVSALSMCSILIVEPFLSFLIFHQWPTRGALVGMVLAIVGMVATLVDETPLQG